MCFYRLRVKNVSLEGKIASNKADLEKVSAELARATDGLFSAENAKLHAEEKFSTTNAKLSRLEKDSEEKDRNISMVDCSFHIHQSDCNSSSSSSLFPTPRPLIRLRNLKRPRATWRKSCKKPTQTH